MISIITAIYNQRPVNVLFWENLSRYTKNAFELIIIDNGSTDGSGDFFESVGAKVIRNAKNYSYPHSQNQGIAEAHYDWLAFLNNDVIVSPDWDAVLMDSMVVNELEVASACGIEQVESGNETRKLKRRWKRIKSILGLFGHSKNNLQRMHLWMYGHWDTFCHNRRMQFRHQIKEGFVGNTVMIRRAAFDKIGLWDEQQQSADFDLYLRSKVRARDIGDIKPMHVCLDVFVHHYIRLTMRGTYPPFVDGVNLISLSEKWSEEERMALQLLNK